MTTFSGGGLGLGTAVLVLDVDGSKLQTEIERDLKVAGAKLKAFGKEIETSFSGHAKTISKSFGDIGTQATQLGAAVSRAFLPIGVGLGLGVKAAIDFESSFAGVKKTVNATDAEFVKLAQSFRDLSKVIPINVNELNNIGAAAGALGIKKENIVEFTETMALLGVTTNLTSDQAATSIAQIQNIFNAAGKDTKNFASALVALGNDGASTESQIVDFAARLAGAGHQIGLSEQQVLGFGAALANVGLNAELGGTALSKVMSKMSVEVDKGGAKLDAFAKMAGMTSKAFASLFKQDAAAAITAYIEGLGRAGKAGQNLTIALNDVGLKSSNVQDAMKRLAGAGDQVRTALDLSAKAWQDNTALTIEAQKRFETTEAKLTLFWNRLKDVGITFGNALLPAINSLLDAFDSLLPILDRVATVFAGLPVPVQAVAGGIGLIAAATGPALLVFGQMAKGTSALIALFTTLAATATTAAIAEDALAVSTSGVTMSTAGFQRMTATGGLTSWGVAVGTASTEVAGLGTATAGATTSMGLFATAIAVLTSPITLWTVGLGLAALAIYEVATAETDLEKSLRTNQDAFRETTNQLGAALETYKTLTGQQHLTEQQTKDLDAATRLLAGASGLSVDAFKKEEGASGNLTTALIAQLHARKDLLKAAVDQAKTTAADAESALQDAKDRLHDVLSGTATKFDPAIGGGAPTSRGLTVDERIQEVERLNGVLGVLQTKADDSRKALEHMLGASGKDIDLAAPLDKAGNAITGVGNAAKGTKDQLAAWKAELAGLSDSSEEGRDRLGELRQQIELGVLSTKELAGQFEISEQAIKLYKSQISEAAKYHKSLIKTEKEEETELQRMQTDLNKVSVAFDKMNEAADRADEKLQFGEIGQQLDQVARRIGSTGQVLSDAFSVFGMRSRDELEEVAAEAQKAYGLIVASVGEHAPEAIEAHRKMIEAMNAATGKLDGFKFFGMQSREELQSVADQAVLAYKDIVATVGSRAPEAIAAHQKMVEAINAATLTIAQTWQDKVMPRIVQVVAQTGQAVDAHLTDIVVGASAFKDGFLKVWHDIQHGVGDTVTAIVQNAQGKLFGPLVKGFTDLFPQTKTVMENITLNVSHSFGEMLAGAKGFKDGFLDIWHEIKAGIGQILTAILQDFEQRFLKGLLGMLTGQSGAFSAAFSGLFGAGGLAGLIGGGAALPAVAAGGTFGGLVPGGAAGGGAAAGGLAGALGGLGAGAAGLGLGWLGTKLFGGAGAAAGAFGGASGAATGALIGSIVPGIGTAIGALIGGLSGIIGGLFGKTAKTKTNDLRDQVLAQFGGGGTGEGSGFATLAAQLNQATGSNALFESFLKADTPKKFADALAMVNAALQENATKTAAAAAASADHSAKIDEVNAKLKEQTDALNTQMAGLNDELAKIDASEAPEEHMGAVERAARDRIAAQQAIVRSQLEAVKEAAAAAIKAIEDASVGTSDAIGAAARAAAAAAAGAAQAAHNAFTKYHDEWTSGNWQGRTAPPQFMPGVEPPDSAGLGNSPYMPAPMAGGGFGTVSRPTLFLAGEAGREQVAFSGAGKTFGESGGTQKAEPSLVIQQVNLYAPQNATPDWVRRSLDAMKEEIRRGGSALESARAIVRLTGATV